MTLNLEQKKLLRRKNRFFYWMLPSLLLTLIRSGHIKKEDESDVSRVIRILKRKKKFATKRMKLGITLQDTFVQEAKNAWRKGDKNVAIVLLATALEQCINTYLRDIIEAKGFQAEHVTNLIRSQNIEAKMTWIFEMFSGKSLPKQMLNKSKKIFDIRNMIVHYKAVSAHPDTFEGSHNKIDKEIEALGRFRVGLFFLNFNNVCGNIALQCDPALELALNLREKIMPYKKSYE